MSARIILSSEAIHAVHYEKATRVLTIWYKSSPRKGYCYHGVPMSEFMNLLTTSDRGAALLRLKRYVCVPVNVSRLDKAMHRAVTVTNGKLDTGAKPAKPTTVTA